MIKCNLKTYICHYLILLGTLLPATVVNSDSSKLLETINYSYIQATFATGTADYDDSIDQVEGSGIGFKLSLAFPEHYAFTLAVIETTFDTFQDEIVDSSKATTIGLTVHAPIAAEIDVFANLALLKGEITATKGEDTVSEEDFGYEVNIGLRHLVTDNIEVEVAGQHVFVFDDVDNAIRFNGRYYVYERISLGLGYTTGDVVDALFFNLRLDV